MINAGRLEGQASQKVHCPEWIEIALYASSALHCGSDVRLTTEPSDQSLSKRHLVG